MPTDTAADVIAREFGYFLRQESAIGRPEDFADYLTRELADAGYTIVPALTVGAWAKTTGVLRAALGAIAARAHDCSPEAGSGALGREGCLEEIETLANLALHDSRQTDDQEKRP